MKPFPKLPPRLAHAFFHQLCVSLPPPLDTSPDARNLRDMMAMTAVAALDAADAAEATIAIRVVAAEAHGQDCLRLASLHHDDPVMARSCRAQAAAMMRAAQGGMRMLRDLQETRPIPAPEPEIETAAPEPVQDAPRDPGFRLAFAPESPPARPTTWTDRDVTAFIESEGARLGLPRFAWGWIKLRAPDGRLIDPERAAPPRMPIRAETGHGRAAAMAR